ncbi:MAG: hypothetical protein E7107_15875 [Prevotella sp.]|nr:hypothetical protein [Prevotella sp.]
MKKRKQQEERSLLGAWVCDMANRLMNESGVPMTQSEAFEQAHLVRRLLEKLGEGYVVFVYEKNDGELRVARGTLCKGADPAFDNYVRKTDENNRKTETLNFNYWDLERKRFRKFSALHVRCISSAWKWNKETEEWEYNFK